MFPESDLNGQAGQDMEQPEPLLTDEMKEELREFIRQLLVEWGVISPAAEDE